MKSLIQFQLIGGPHYSSDLKAGWDWWRSYRPTLFTSAAAAICCGKCVHCVRILSAGRSGQSLSFRKDPIQAEL